MNFVDYFLLFFLLFYLLYTFSFALKFNKTDIYYNTNQKIVHNILIWIIPFLWIMLLKSMDKPRPNRHIFNSTDSSESIDAGWWTIGLYSIFHGANHSSSNENSGHDSSGHDNHAAHDFGGSDSSGHGGHGGH